MPLIGNTAGLSPLLALIAMAIIIAVLLLRSQRYFARRGNDASPIVRAPRPEPDGAAGPTRAPGGTAEWEIRMHHLARDLSGQLDSKMGVLEQLIREADRAAARLEAALEKEEGVRNRFPGRPSRPAESDKEVPDTLSPPDQAEKLKSAGVVDAAESSDRKRRYDEIYTLADYGFAASEIAQRTGMPVGEVELILGLRDER